MRWGICVGFMGAVMGFLRRILFLLADFGLLFVAVESGGLVAFFADFVGFFPFFVLFFCKT
jgi:hypothetical protein